MWKAFGDDGLGRADRPANATGHGCLWPGAFLGWQTVEEVSLLQLGLPRGAAFPQARDVKSADGRFY
jgi:hypothetical protein